MGDGAPLPYRSARTQDCVRSRLREPVAFHLILVADLDAQTDDAPVRPHSLAVEGFVHLTHRMDDLIDVANALYREEPGPHVVLTINLDRLSAPWRYDGDDRFPHVYGPLDRDAVTSVDAISRGPDGAFLA